MRSPLGVGSKCLILAIAMLFVCTLGVSAEFNRQPATWSSSLCTSSGLNVYDWQLANMISMHIAQPGFANMVFVFGECYGGGMLDELQADLAGKGDVALASASRHDEMAWYVTAAMLAASRVYWNRLGYVAPIGFYIKEMVNEMARTGRSAVSVERAAQIATGADPVRQGGRNPLGRPWGDYRPGVPIVEHPQWVEIGNGGDIKLGFKTNGEPAASRHAILFAGNANTMADWGDLEAINQALVTNHRFPAENVHILAGGGPGSRRPDGSAVPGYVDGAGTRDALWEAIRTVGQQMNANEQFVFFGLDHGNRERTDRAMDQVITDYFRTLLQTSEGDTLWHLDQAFLNDIQAVPDNSPYVSVIADGIALDTCGAGLVVHANGVQLSCGGAAEIIAWDDDPDVDATEFVFPIRDESVLDLENTIEIEWVGDPDAFVEYTVLGLQISTGAMHVSPDPVEERQDACAPTPPQDLMFTFGASTTLPGFGVELTADATLDLAPLLVTSQTDVVLLPSFMLAESLNAGLVWDWVSLMTNLDMSIVPWALVTTGATASLTPPAITFGATPAVAIQGSTGWSTQWGSTGFTHTATGSVSAEAAWPILIPGGDIDLTIGTSAGVSVRWPGSAVFGEWDVTIDGSTILPFDLGEGTTLRANAAASLFVLPAFGGGIDLRLEFCTDAVYAYAEVVLGLGGILFELGGEVEFGIDF